ncbi:MAG TPA: multidrug efflux RND transporter permease subunit [Terriglobales bacterium]|nr:multidrug efflux RND transporter permease subunit [Terriglobales bacterium]
MNISAPFIRRPVATSLLTLALLLAGALAYTRLPVAPLPQVEYPVIYVGASLPGASPETMASSVATPLERQFGRIAGVNEMTSTSQLGSTSIALQFDLTRNIDAAGRDVQAAINAARGQLPANLPYNPYYRKVNPADAPIMILNLTSPVHTLPQMYDSADSILAQKIAQVEGVGQVFVGGGAQPAVRVEANPTALGQYGISLEQIRTALANANANTPKGAFSNTNKAWTITSNDQIKEAYQYRPLIVAYNNGNTVRLSDVANVRDSVADIRTAGLSNGDPAVLVIIFRQPGANIIDTVDRLYAELPTLQASIPPSMHIGVVMDRTTTIRASVHDVQVTLLVSIALVVMVVFLFLRKLSATIIPSIAVPLSLVGTFGVMYLLGYSLDNLSLMALTISTGFVVDDAIVVIENITRHIESGMRPYDAAMRGSREIGFTVLSMSTSLVAVFIPILLMGGLVGRLFREFAVTLSIAITVSLVVSLTTTPMMCAKFLKSDDHKKRGAIYRAGDRFFDWMLATYRGGLSWILRHQPLTLGITGVAIALNIFLFIVIPKGFFPQQDAGRLMGMIQGEQDISFTAMREKLVQYVNIVDHDPAVQNVVAFTGGNTASNQGRMFITLTPMNERKISADEVIARLRPKLAHIPGATLYLQAAQDLHIGGRMSNAQYQYTLQDENLDELNTWAPKMLAKLKTVKQLKDVSSDQQDRGLQTQLVIDRDSAARFGITAQAIDNTLYDAFGQRQVSTIYMPLNQYHVVMEIDPQFQGKPDSLKYIYVPASDGSQVPLSAVAHYELRNTSLAVNHQGQFPSVTLSFNLAPGESLSEATRAIDLAGQQIGLPATVHATYQGTAAAFRDSLRSEPYLILAALVAVYIVLGVLYESFIHPITILSTLPSAGVGAFLALLLFHTEFSVIALIGVILLIGIVKKNAIMMVDFALMAERTEGKDPEGAIFEACLLRFRPIMMTTMAAMFGALPLALGTNVGAELRRPLGIAIVGGLIVSQMLTLFTTPVIYLYLDRFQWRLRRRKAERRAAKEAKEPVPAVHDHAPTW